jgi:hypothetical protein
VTTGFLHGSFDQYRHRHRCGDWAIGGICVGSPGGRCAASGKQFSPLAPVVNGWALRKNLTGTQLQILIFLEAQKYATIGDLETKFEFIPDRELNDRLQQIVLLAFVSRGREHGDVVYMLNPADAATIEDDKAVMLSS